MASAVRSDTTAQHPIMMVANGDLRPSANIDCWPAQADESLRLRMVDSDVTIKSLNSNKIVIDLTFQ